MQLPFTQEPSPQERPQEPQLFESVWVLTQAPLQTEPPGGQVQEPITHDAPAAQPMPHMPQLVTSVWVLTQVFPQRVVPIGHWQVPP